MVRIRSVILRTSFGGIFFSFFKIKTKSRATSMSSSCGMFFSTLLLLQGHGKVTVSDFSVVDIDGCPPGTVYFVYHNAKLPLTLSF